MEVEIPGGTAVIREKLTVGGRQLEDTYTTLALPAFRKAKRNAELVLEWAKREKAAEDEATAAGLSAPTRSSPPAQEAFTVEEATASWNANYAMVLSRLASWTLPEPLPTMETISDLDGDTWDVLNEKAKELRAANKPPTVSVDDVEDRDSPTGPFTDSEASSSPVEGESTPETEPSATSGPSTSTDKSST